MASLSGTFQLKQLSLLFSASEKHGRIQTSIHLIRTVLDLEKDPYGRLRIYTEEDRDNCHSVSAGSIC